MQKALLGEDVIQKYKKYENTTTNLKSYTINQQVFRVDQKYEPQAVMGQGAYGMVIAARDTKQNTMVGIKKICKAFEHKLYTRRTLRELKLLRLLKHPNIMSIYTIELPRSRLNFEDIYVVSELMEMDLWDLIKSDQKLNDDHLIFFMSQVLEGLKFMHKANVIHRDLKPRNLLINSECELKICDFGLSRVIDPKIYMSTSYVTTRWYRAPQLLLGCEKYTPAIDLWSVGVIFAELILRKPFLPGHTTKNQIERILKLLGTNQIQGIKQISEEGKKLIRGLSKKNAISFETVFPNTSATALDLLKRLLSLNPQNRITAEEALKHPYFQQNQKEEKQTEIPAIDLREFQFQNHRLTREQLKDIIYQQILLYHDKDFYLEYQEKKKKGEPLYQQIFTNSNSKLRQSDEDD